MIFIVFKKKRTLPQNRFRELQNLVTLPLHGERSSTHVVIKAEFIMCPTFGRGLGRVINTTRVMAKSSLSTCFSHISAST